MKDYLLHLLSPSIIGNGFFTLIGTSIGAFLGGRIAIKSIEKGKESNMLVTYLGERENINELVKHFNKIYEITKRNKPVTVLDKDIEKRIKRYEENIKFSDMPRNLLKPFGALRGGLHRLYSNQNSYSLFGEMMDDTNEFADSIKKNLNQVIKNQRKIERILNVKNYTK